MPQSVEGIQHGLSWAGLDYDFGMFSVVTLPRLVETTRHSSPPQGPGRSGPHGPYFQVCALTCVPSLDLTMRPLVGEIGFVSSLLKKVA